MKEQPTNDEPNSVAERLINSACNYSPPRARETKIPLKH